MAQYSVYRPPWSSFDQLRREMNSLFEGNAGAETRPTGWRGVYPPVNLYETPDAYMITAELPGIDPSDIHVSLEDTTVTLEGERKNESEGQSDATPHRRERQAGSFRRAFSLPAKVEADKVEAVHKNGVLMLRVPKSPEAQPRQIEVQAS